MKCVCCRVHFAGIRGDDLYLRMGPSVYDGKGLLLGPHSPFTNIPILTWILYEPTQHCKYTKETDEAVWLYFIVKW